LKNYLSLIKFSHTIFALPFAIVGFYLALMIGNFEFNLQKLFAIILCMFFARSAAMAFNRYIDRDIDAKNPRTQIREIPAGIVSAKNALMFTILCCIAFIITTYFINTLCFYLSPIALLIILGYSYTKRFTYWCHLVLGLGLSLAPLGAFLAVTNEFHVIPIFFSVAVLCWVSGFDIIYSLQDENFDREMKLYSMPTRFGGEKALLLSRMLHFFSASSILLAGYFLKANSLFWIGALIFIGLLIYQHTIVKANNLSRVNAAFFTTNGLASILFSIFFVLNYYFYIF